MANWNITDADDYIRLNTLDNDDWFSAEEDRKTAFLNVSKRTIENAIEFDEGEEAPDEAVYEFAPVLAYTYNDTNKLAQQGVASFGLRGINFTFKDWSKYEIRDFIPDSVFEICGKPRRSVKDVIM